MCNAQPLFVVNYCITTCVYHTIFHSFLLLNIS
jgi:hypothetical protein